MMKQPGLAKRLPQLSEEEAALRHRLELQVERSLYRAAVGLQQLGNVGNAQSSELALLETNSDWVLRHWGNEQQIATALSQAKAGLQEIYSRKLYRSSHQSFDQYLQERFGWRTQELYPATTSLRS